MKSDIRMRKATVADKTTLCALGKKTFHETFDPYNTAEDMESYVSVAFTDEQLESELKEKDTVFFLAEDGAIPAGYIKLRKGEKQEALPEEQIELHRIYVDKEYFGQGVGEALLQAGLEYAKQAGCKVIWLGVWEENERAIAFYRKKGFEKFSSHVFLLGTDPQTDWLMKKDI